MEGPWVKSQLGHHFLGSSILMQFSGLRSLIQIIMKCFIVSDHRIRGPYLVHHMTPVTTLTRFFRGLYIMHSWQYCVQGLSYVI